MCQLPSDRTVCLATAHPAKFEEAVTLSLAGLQIPPRPQVLDELFHLPERKVFVENDLATVQEYILGKLSKGKKPAPVGPEQETVGWTWIFATVAVAAAAGIILLRARK